MSYVRRFLRMLRASRLFGEASRLARRDRNRDAAEILKTVLEILPAEAPGSSVLVGPALQSLRLCATTLRAQVAAKLGDIPLAVASIREGLALWTNTDLPRRERFHRIVQWEAWAREYLAWAERQGGH